MYARNIQIGETIDYTAGTASVSAGDIVIQGGTAGKLAGVAVIDIPANTLGALATKCVFDIVKSNSVSFSVGDPVYWDETNHVTTNSSAGNPCIGTSIADAGTASNCAKVLFNGSIMSKAYIDPASAIVSLTDESWGSASNTIREIEDATLADACASFAAKINAILVALRQTGIIES